MVVEGEVLVDVVDSVQKIGGVVEDASPDAVPCVMGVGAVVRVAGVVGVWMIQRAAYA